MKKRSNAEIAKLVKALEPIVKRWTKAITSNIEIITPAQAEEYLKHNLSLDTVRNRKTDRRAINRYSNDMIHGRWKLSSIQFDIEGNLINGCNRLNAVKEADVPVSFIVERGLDTDTYAHTDSGKRRAIKDVMFSLSYDGIFLTSPTQVGAAIVIAHNYMNDSKHVDKDWLYSNSEADETVKNDFFYYDDPFKYRSIQTWHKNIGKSIRQSVLAAFYYIYKKSCGNLVDDFFDIMTTNNEKTPAIIRKFRDNLMENKSKVRGYKGYMTTTDIMHRMDVLFTYHQGKGGLKAHKDFAKKDLIF